MPGVTNIASSAAGRGRGTARAVCVDLDGTLVAADLLWESFVALARARPVAALGALRYLVKGRAPFKRRIAHLMPIDASALPYRQELLEHLRDLRRRGAYLVLATASDDSYARAVAEHLDFFDDVVASDGVRNLAGAQKAAALVEKFGRHGFDYFGNDRSDLPVWRVAAGATLVGASPRLVRRATGNRGIAPVARVREGRRRPLTMLLRALRPHQWVKNLLVFVPFLAAHRLLELEVWWKAALTFTTFSLAASAIYVLNDILDIPSDRLHPRKRSRPFAAGELGIPTGIAATFVLLTASVALARLLVSSELVIVVLAYVVITTAYSLFLKRQPVGDVFTVTGLYVLRIVAGGVATQTPLSSWLLVFALFLFLSLAFIKRYTELRATPGHMPGRAYGHDDVLWMHSIGVTSGYMAVLVLALYVNASDVAALYTRPHVLWLLCPALLFWLTRLWFRAGRHLLHDDPVVEALGDPASWVTALIALGVTLAAV